MTEGASPGFFIGDVSRAVGIGRETLRLWERERPVMPKRTERGYRVYGEADVKRLRKIKRLRKVEGWNFAAIRQQLEPSDILYISSTVPHRWWAEEDPAAPLLGAGRDTRRPGAVHSLVFELYLAAGDDEYRRCTWRRTAANARSTW